MPSQDFAGKLAIITGASKANGIGFAVAQALAKAGADLMLHYNSNKVAAEESASKLRQLGVKVATVQGDAGSLSFGEDIVKATLAAFPRRKIDIIINNAGFATFHENAEKSVIEEFDTVFHANVRGPHLLIKAALPHITSPGGHIVNVGTIVSRLGSKFAAFYASSKGALSSLTVSWAEELGEKGITINVVSPGPIDTDYAPPEGHPLTVSFRVQQHIKRNGTAEEVANAIVFAASPGASFMTGQLIGVDGGINYA